jgi:hypothetical protein
MMSRAELERGILVYDMVLPKWPDPPPHSPLLNLFRQPGPSLAEQREAEERDRREWIEGIRRRLGLVTEVHRCCVWESVGLWHWWCLRGSCGGAKHNMPWADAFAGALAHARSFVPQPPEPEPFPELTWEAYMALAADVPVVRAEEALRAALPGRMAEITEQINGAFAGLLPEGMRFEWTT